MARNGKIARLPRAVRAQLNSRLEDGGEGKQITQWLNALPAVRRVLAESFGGNPVTEQNLSDWRLGGYEEWRVCQDLVAQAADLAAHRQELEAAAPGQTPADLLAAAITFRYSTILAGQGPDLDETAITQLNALSRICQAVAQLRRSDHNAARLKIENERWELERQRIRTEDEEETKRKLRATLAAHVLTQMKVPEWCDKLGGGPRAQMAAEVLREIEMCQDPAHFNSEILTSRTPEEWNRYFAELAKNAPPKKTEMQASLDTYRQMEAGLGIRKAGKKAGSSQPPSKGGRRAGKAAGPRARRCKGGAPKGRKGLKGQMGRMGAEPEARRYNATADSGQPDAEVHQVQEVQEVHPAPAAAGGAEAPGSAGASPCPPSVEASANGSEAPIVPNRA